MTTVTAPIEVPAKHMPGPIAGILIVVFLYFGSQIIGSGLVGYLPLLAGISTSTLDRWTKHSAVAEFVYVLIVEALTLGGLLLLMRGLQVAPRAIGLIKPRLRDFGITLLAYPPYFVLNAAAALAATAVFQLDTAQKQEFGFDSAQGGLQLACIFISLVVLPPVVEEIVMRGFLFSSLKTKLKVVPAALLTSVIFATAHLQFGNGVPLLWLAAIDTFVLSLVLCYLRQKTGSLWPGIGLHALKNGIAFTALYIFPTIHSTF